MVCWAGRRKTSTSSLLRLPLELRIAIYEDLIYEEIYVQDRSQGKAKGIARLFKKKTTRYWPSWCNAMLVNRQICSELQQYMEKKKDTLAGKTWTIQLPPLPCVPIEPASRTLPCSLKDLKIVRFDIPLEDQPWWTPDTVNLLCRNIDYYIHHFPILPSDRSLTALRNHRRLDEPMSINEVILAFTWLGHEPNLDELEDPVTLLRQFFRRNTRRMSDLSDWVDEVTFIVDGEEHL